MGIVDPKTLDIGEHQTTAWGEAAYAPWSAGWSCTCGESERRGSWDFDRAFEAAKWHMSEHKARKISDEPDRPSEDQNLMDIASVVARRSTCRRLKVGAVLVRDSRVLSTGRNGAPVGRPHCQSTEAAPCSDCCHAEANSLIFAARHGVSVLGATMYCSDAPCKACAGLAINAGIAEVVYSRPYRLDDGLRRLEAAGITVRKLG